MGIVQRCRKGEFGADICEFLGHAETPKEAKRIADKDIKNRRLLGMDKAK